MRNSIKIFAALLLILSPVLSGQDADSVKLKALLDLGFYPYPAMTDLAKNMFDDSLMQSIAALFCGHK